MNQVKAEIMQLQRQSQQLKAVREYLSSLGAIGGSSKSKAKSKAARINGKKGGRPKKKR